MRDNSTLQYVRDCMENEGTSNAFTCYSDFPEVQDEEFHRLRRAYLEAYNAIETYVMERTS